MTEFDAGTCNTIRERLVARGRMVMNALVAHDIDPLADQIAARLCGPELTSWIVDEPGIEQRNAVIACLPEKMLAERAALKRMLEATEESWKIRRPRLRKSDLAIGGRRL